MDPLDQTIAQALDESLNGLKDGPAQILLIGDDAAQLAGVLKQRGHRCMGAGVLADAVTLLTRAHFELIVVNPFPADGDGVDLPTLAQKTAPWTKMVVIGRNVSVASTVQAMRWGAVDMINLPVDAGEFAQRIDLALVKSRTERQRHDRLNQLKKICQELNIVRQTISGQVDDLCNDLVNAYQEIAEQMNDVATASEFRTLLKQELDVEDLLRTALEYLLTKTGPTNAAVFLPDTTTGGRQHYGLGAYVNYDCPRETISLLLDHLGHAVCPQMADESEIVSFTDAREFAQWIGAEAGFLAESHVIAFSCHHEQGCMAVIVLFRNRSTPFDEKLAATIDTLRSILAEQLTHVIKVHHRSRPSWPADADESDLDCNDDLGFGFEGGLAA